MRWLAVLTLLVFVGPLACDSSEPSTLGDTSRDTGGAGDGTDLADGADCPHPSGLDQGCSSEGLECESSDICGYFMMQCTNGAWVQTARSHTPDCPDAVDAPDTSQDTEPKPC